MYIHLQLENYNPCCQQKEVLSNNHLSIYWLESKIGKQLIQTCLNSPDPVESSSSQNLDEQRMSAQGFEEPELSYVPLEGKVSEIWSRDEVINHL